MALTLQPHAPPRAAPIPNPPTTSITNQPHLLRLLTNCSTLSHLKQIHAHTLRTQSDHNSHPFFLYSKILQFASITDLDYAYRVFDQIQNPNSFTWNTLIGASARSSDRKSQAILLYYNMVCEGLVAPDKYTFPFLLKACAYLFALSEGKQAHAHVIKLGLDPDVYVNNSLIHFYSSCGCLEPARKVFDEMTQRSLVSWNVMIDALVQFGEYENALKLFVELQSVHDPDGYTIQSAINACAGLGALSLGIWVHVYLLRNNSCAIDNNILLNSSLVDMYCKCGSLELANQLFEKMPERDLNTWNSMILGLSNHGQANTVFERFTRLVEMEKLKPNSITFVGILNACNHTGMVSEGRKYFNMMINDYNIEPQIEHYGCLVDLLARSGFIHEALDLVSNMPIKPDPVIYRSLLDAFCKTNPDVKLSEEIALQILQTEKGTLDSGVYVLLSRVYALANKWNSVGLIRKLMNDEGAVKEPGCSLIEIDGISHEFIAGDTSHPQSKEIYEVVDLIEEKLERIGYKVDYTQAAILVDGDNIVVERRSLRVHSERLAIALGLLKLKRRIPIRVFKNLRVCNDCHEVVKLISSMFKVEIIMRDRARFHCFKDGICSCNDFW